MSLLALKYLGVAICGASSVLRKCHKVKINASRMDAEFDGIATGLSTAITKDGQTTVTADLPMATFKHTGVGNAAARTDYASAGQVQDGAFTSAAAGGAADIYTLTLDPAITAYAANQRFLVPIIADNTGACTLNVSGVGAKSIKISDGAGALIDPTAGDLDTVVIADVIYNGTVFILQNPAIPTSPGSLLGVTIITASGTYSPSSAAVTKIRVTVTGGGGGSGGVEANSVDRQSGGGGSGGTAIMVLNISAISAPVTVTVGAAGAAGASGNNDGTAGGTTSFGAHCTGVGGGAGLGSVAGTIGNSGVGGLATGGDLQLRGARGESGYSVYDKAASTTWVQTSTDGAHSYWGPAGGGSKADRAYGGGGPSVQENAGGGAAQPGVAGVAGVCIVEEFA